MKFVVEEKRTNPRKPTTYSLSAGQGGRGFDAHSRLELVSSPDRGNLSVRLHFRDGKSYALSLKLEEVRRRYPFDKPGPGEGIADDLT